MKKSVTSALLYVTYGPHALSVGDYGKRLLLRGLKNRARQIARTVKWFFRKSDEEVLYQGEFGSELKWAVPYAYWHYLRGTLKKTASYRDTADFYFFSQCHEEVDDARDYICLPGIPNSEDHNFRFSLKQWAPVPYKERFKDDLRFRPSKPILIISNKFNNEWGRGPINFIPVETLVEIARSLQSNYQIVYNRPQGGMIVADHNTTEDWNDKSKLKELCPEILLTEDLYMRDKSLYRSFNHFQLALYAHCEHFISVQGGNSVLASYFGGTNIVMCKRGLELEFREYEHLYGRFSGAKIVLCKNEAELLEQVKRRFSYAFAATARGCDAPGAGHGLLGGC